MKVTMVIRTRPDSFDLEDEISNLYQDEGLVQQLEALIEAEIEKVMDWRDIRVDVELNF